MDIFIEVQHASGKLLHANKMAVVPYVLPAEGQSAVSDFLTPHRRPFHSQT